MTRSPFIIEPGTKLRLADHDPGFTGEFTDKKDARAKLKKDVERLAKYQELLYVQNSWAVLVILQGMDGSGKDGVIKHVMSGLDPQGTQVTSFKRPSGEELDHDYLWRSSIALPARGNIGIFNRSYYEEVVVVRVHPDLLGAQRLPRRPTGAKLWAERFEDINAFERYLTRNGIVVLKFFLHISKQEQKKRLLERIDRPDKQWKFSAGDTTQRAYWGEYEAAYEEAISRTSTTHAPWYVVPADHKWFTRAVVADTIVRRLKSLRLAYPTPDEDAKRELAATREELEKS